MLTSLAALQRASTLQKVQKKLDVSKTSLGALSESLQIAGPEKLKQIAKELGDQQPLKLAGNQTKGFEPSTINRLSGPWQGDHGCT